MEPIIIYEDESLVVINKPSGMVSNDAETVREETVQSWFAKQYSILNAQSSNDSEFLQKGGLVHRLDKDTSGVMVLAKTEEAYEALKSQFLERKTIKKYVALVHGEMSEPSGIISAPIDRHPKDRKKFTISDNLSRTAITEWKVIKAFSVQGLAFSLLELTPHTGRTHQLRVHLQSISHPIVSDPIYGWAKKIKDDLKWCPRLFLHAKYLEFTHPISKLQVSFEAELPEDLSQVIH
ncbi:MAG: Pseudouridine synthase [Candidatus Amesbacteria bacterium GW2011_GWA2_42_12]|uniref:Pseudouridine synthase n=1 Tax=Candidatus Amesbacteria bacterium GW2011_GWA2_42_12 TaxID=1618356 RepID=A0A0G0Y8Q3_9BACT|nr:MAG: Pseudouridine synthase [Candidatus Amesbacteria bacterium GW2011_GWA2_42_12]